MKLAVASPQRKSHAFLLLALIFLFSCAPISARAERKKAEDIPAPPPLALALDIEVFQGESVAIPLIARGRGAADARFILRSRPRLGRLGDVRSVRPGQAVIEYKHGGGPVPATDEFLFAVQAPDSPVSAPAKIRIFARKRPAELVLPGPIDFGRVYLGELAEKTLTLANSGGEELPLTLKVPEFFELPEGTDYVVRGGESLRVPLRFVPKRAGEFEGVVRFSHNDKLLVPLRGIAVEPFRITPAALTMRQDDSLPQPDFLELENRTEGEIAGTIEADEGVEVVSQFKIPPGATLRLPVTPTQKSLPGASGNLQIRHPYGGATIPFQVFPAPARVMIQPTESLDFGTLEKGGSSEREIELRNTGGLPVNVAITPPMGVEIVGAMDFQLPAGSSNKVMLKFHARRSGSWQENLVIQTGTEQRLIPMRARVTASADPERTAYSLRDGKVFPVPETQPDSVQTGDLLPLRPDNPFVPSLPVLEWNNLRIISSTPTSLVIEWETDAAPDRTVTIEQRSLGIAEDGRPLINWERCAKADVFRIGDKTLRATLFSLQPGSRLTLRHAVRDDKGELRAVSENIFVEIPPPPKGFRLPWMWILAALAVAVLIWYLRRRREAERAEADAQIRRLERID